MRPRHAFLALILVSIPLAAAAADPLPLDVDSAMRAFLTAPAEKKDFSCDRLLDAYVPYLRAGEDWPPVDAAIVEYLSPESLANLVTRLSLEGTFSPLQTACLARLEALGLKGRDADMVSSARGLHAGLSLLAEGARDRAQWERIAQGLNAGWRFFPSKLYADKLQNALRRSGDRRGLFQFKAYRYVDESGPNPFRCAGLWFAWLFLQQKQGFPSEMALVKERIKQDIISRSPSVTGLPRFGGEVFFTTGGEPRPLSFRDARSSLHGKRAVFVFFQTTCNYCIGELKALGRIYPGYLKKHGDTLSVIGLKQAMNLPAGLGALAPLEKELGLPFELLENDASGVFKAYGVKHVPLLIFFDEQGAPLWTVTFHGQGHLEEKLSWFIDDLLDDVAMESGGVGREPL